MKKIRIISLMLVVLMLALALASCGGYQKLGDIYKGEYIDNSPAYTAAKELSAIMLAETCRYADRSHYLKNI